MLPVLYFHGKKIRKTIPDLPEATGNQGEVNIEDSKPFNIISLGESTIAGVGADKQEEAFTGTLAKKLSDSLRRSVHWKVYAKSGYIMKRVNDKIIPKIKEPKLDLIVIGMGGNDAFRMNSLKNWNKEINRCIKLLRANYNCPILFINMPPIKEFPAFSKTIKYTIGNLVEFFGQALKENIEHKENVFFIDEIIKLDVWKKRLNITQKGTEPFYSDGVHPSLFTYQVWAKETAQYIFDKQMV